MPTDAMYQQQPPPKAKSDVAAKFDRRAALWRRERNKLDLDLEQSPLESRFSPQLADLMAREEQMVGQEIVDTPIRKAAAQDLYKRVDDLLKLETRKYFESATAHAHRKWSQLFQKQAREQTKCRDDVDRKTKALLVKGAVVEPVPPVDDFAAREQLMRRKTAEHWRESARFDLREAFALQLARVDVEWEAYEHRLRLDVDARLAELDASHISSPSRQSDSPSHRWKSKEKQELLVHTAPVLSPGRTPKLLSPGNRHDTTKVMSPERSSETKRAALEVEAQYRDALARIASQKDTARRWIRRQAGRMTAQVDCSEPVRRFLATRLNAAEEAERVTRRQCQAFDAAMSGLPATKPSQQKETPSPNTDPVLLLPDEGPRLTPQRLARLAAQQRQGRAVAGAARARVAARDAKRVFAADSARAGEGIRASPVRLAQRAP